MKVAELMQANLKTISVDATVADAIDALTEAQVTALPVVDRLGRAVGVIATRDILRAESFADSHARNLLFEQTTVLEVMSSWPPTIGSEGDVKEAAEQMLYLNAQRLFVEQDGVLVGVISQSDIVGAVARARIPAV